MKYVKQKIREDKEKEKSVCQGRCIFLILRTLHCSFQVSNATGNPLWDRMMLNSPEEEWKATRTMMSPAFTTSRLKAVSNQFEPPSVPNVFTSCHKKPKEAQQGVRTVCNVSCIQLYGRFLCVYQFRRNR